MTTLNNSKYYEDFHCSYTGQRKYYKRKLTTHSDILNRYTYIVMKKCFFNVEMLLKDRSDTLCHSVWPRRSATVFCLQ